VEHATVSVQGKSAMRIAAYLPTKFYRLTPIILPTIRDTSDATWWNFCSNRPLQSFSSVLRRSARKQTLALTF